jgi:hypothetical protein
LSELDLTEGSRDDDASKADDPLTRNLDHGPDPDPYPYPNPKPEPQA